MKNKLTGKQGEDIACEYLIKQGYKILDRNIHFSRYCEIDIIALDKNNTVVAVEVKTRTSAKFGYPEEAVTKEKYQNIRYGLLNYLKENTKYKNSRIDVLSILLTPTTTIKHLKNI